MAQVAVRNDRSTGNLYSGSFMIDKYLNAKAVNNNKNVQMEVVQQIKEEKRLLVYYLYRYPGEPQISAARMQYFWFELTSRELFTQIQQKRQGIMGFEIGVKEISAAEIPGLSLPPFVY
jgi:hypothetical protein